jgi:electron-transferring-flavoprotein dehydrogenase
MQRERERIDFDVLFVGGGPAGLAGAIRLMQRAGALGLEPEVALIDKGPRIGAHAVSGAILNPVALAELIPDFIERGCPIEATVREDAFYYLTPRRAWRLPLVPPQMRNEGFPIISLSRFTSWLADIAEELGVNVFPGFAGKSVLYEADGRTVAGVRTGDKGLDKEGRPKPNFEAGIDLAAKVTVFAEGARGSLMQEMAPRLDLYRNRMAPVYETGIKEVIELPEATPFGLRGVNDIHLMGYPLGLNTAGGGFIYAMGKGRISIGFLTALSYRDPAVDPYEMLLKFKHHPFVADIIRGGRVIEQGARAVSAGGYYTLPRLAVDGALFVGGGASFQNMPALKGIHLAMQSGMLAADAAAEALQKEHYSVSILGRYATLCERSWMQAELLEGRNFSQALAKSGLLKFLHLGAQTLTRGKGFRDPMPLEEDCTTLKPKRSSVPTTGEADPALLDDTLYVDKLTGVYLSKIQHREDQPCHILVRDRNLCIDTCYPAYGSPCTRFCPGKVYEIVDDEEAGGRRLKLNPSNCFHCKTCDIKDPYRNITWTCPEGGEGPAYKIV